MYWETHEVSELDSASLGYSHLSDTEAPKIPTNSKAPKVPTVFWLGSNISDS